MSEIAERAALILLGGDRDKKIYVYGGLPEWCGNVHGWANLKDVTAIVERAIAESQAPKLRQTLRQIVDRFEEEDRKAGNKSFDERRSPLAWAMYSDAKEGLKLGDGEPSSAPPREIGHAHLGKVCTDPKCMWAGAAQEVSPPSPEPQRAVGVVKALRQWESDTGRKASASEVNAFVDGFEDGYGLGLEENRTEGDTRELKAALAGLLACTEMRGDAAKMLAVGKAKKALKNAG